MREQRFTLLLSCAVFLLCFATQAQSQLSRVYVSETDGNDVPPCGPIKKPCKTFAFSLGQVLPKGHIIVLNTGEFGPARITQSVTIEAPPGVNALVQSFFNSPSLLER